MLFGVIIHSMDAALYMAVHGARWITVMFHVITDEDTGTLVVHVGGGRC